MCLRERFSFFFVPNAIVRICVCVCRTHISTMKAKNVSKLSAELKKKGEKRTFEDTQKKENIIVWNFISLCTKHEAMLSKIGEYWIWNAQVQYLETAIFTVSLQQIFVSNRLSFLIPDSLLRASPLFASLRWWRKKTRQVSLYVIQVTINPNQFEINVRKSRISFFFLLLQLQATPAERMKLQHLFWVHKLCFDFA